ncbi:PREDICTED: factor of DNA methylation 5-like isoform X2 [Brassica oleracea var. oleracea]|uniref:factor of DNA methylation 5-like isoform X2 n=1 Tax=Brassica oleracea var. oleracea TaxID=109376 RepID=UPI0006A70389|nr:PREDICTED: factor of DNA methylation 5-like isoform X2 [Brassica oleracea var. oleracea]
MLEEERCELEQLGDINSALIIKERQSTYELQEAHTELIKGFRDLSGEGSVIGVKRMGEVDEKPFLKVCEQRFNGENVGLQHAMLCSEWQKNINDSAWHPFKLVEVVDDEDDKLKKLSKELGDVMNAVKTALEELNDFNPSGRYSVPAL